MLSASLFFFSKALRELPALSKTKPQNEKATFGEGCLLRCTPVLSPANFVDYLPPHHPPSAHDCARSYLFPRIDSRNAAVWGQNLLMPLHHTIFPLFFFAANSCMQERTMHRKNPISVTSPPSSPPRPPFNPNNPSPLPVRDPSPNIHQKALATCEVRDGFGGDEQAVADEATVDGVELPVSPPSSFGPRFRRMTKTTKTAAIVVIVVRPATASRYRKIVATSTTALMAISPVVVRVVAGMILRWLPPPRLQRRSLASCTAYSPPTPVRWTLPRSWSYLSSSWWSYSSPQARISNNQVVHGRGRMMDDAMEAAGVAADGNRG